MKKQTLTANGNQTVFHRDVRCIPKLLAYMSEFSCVFVTYTYSYSNVCTIINAKDRKLRVNCKS